MPRSDRPTSPRPVGERRPQPADPRLDHLALELLLEVGEDLGHAEQAHHDRHQADAVEQLEPVEGEPRLGRDLVHADQAEHDAERGHQQRLGHGALAQEAQDGEAQHHQAEILGRAEGDGDARQRRRHQHQRDDGEGAGGERAERGTCPAPARRGPAWPSAWPSRQVTTEAASPGMLTRIEVVEPPYMEP